jgi:acetyl/propionyl-CoA carboxylase alpha subunit
MRRREGRKERMRRREGRVWILMPHSVAMGSKTASKEIMIKAGVPCVPGYHGPDQSVENFILEAEKIGMIRERVSVIII